MQKINLRPATDNLIEKNFSGQKITLSQSDNQFRNRYETIIILITFAADQKITDGRGTAETQSGNTFFRLDIDHIEISTQRARSHDKVTFTRQVREVVGQIKLIQVNRKMSFKGLIKGQGFTLDI